MLDVQNIPFLRTVFLIVFGIIGVGCLAALVFGIRAGRFTDKLVAVNLITTLCVNAICMLAVFLRQDYVLDIALIFALLSFTAVVVLVKLRGKKEEEEDGK